MDAQCSSKIVAKIRQCAISKMKFGGNAPANVNPPAAIRIQIVVKIVAEVDANVSPGFCAIKMASASTPTNALHPTHAALTMIAPAIQTYAAMDDANKAVPQTMHADLMSNAQMGVALSVEIADGTTNAAIQKSAFLGNAATSMLFFAAPTLTALAHRFVGAMGVANSRSAHLPKSL